ncbi:MAG: GGDEF domain-containing protein [Candidatus Zixiibacteriota bacterium]|nr:MAG: GGDEF domain-containing protein [candidate division Zixibacteria bacterium]
MLEIILIIVLAVLVVILLALIMRRKHLDKGRFLLANTAVDDLLSSVMNNIASGRIQDVAGSVSDILKKHLGCDRIIFLKYYRSNLELNYISGLKRLDRNSVRVKLNPTLQKKLRSFREVAPISGLKGILSDNYIKKLRSHDLRYFFPVFLRDMLYGVYLISTELAPDNPTLNLLATTLAFNLSTAYHIGLQEQRISKFEDKLRGLADANKTQARAAGTASELLKYLKIRKCEHLIPELLKMLRKDGRFSKLGFYVQSDSPDTQLMAVSWNIPKGADKILRENYGSIVSKIKENDPLDLKDAEKSDKSLADRLKEVRTSNVDYMMSIPWANKRKAVLAWSGKENSGEMARRIRRFGDEALPLIENISRLEKAEELSYTDSLTGMYNLRYFKKRINEEFQRAKRYERNLTLLIFDIDDLKYVNDKYGHLAGDALLKAFGRTLTESVRTNDVISRYGGDEFCLIMPETGHEDAQTFMERIKERIASGKCKIEWGGKSLDYTVSIGGAIYPLDAAVIDGLIHAADMALLRAKEEGRNCAKLYQPEYDRTT